MPVAGQLVKYFKKLSLSNIYIWYITRTNTDNGRDKKIHQGIRVFVG